MKLIFYLLASLLIFSCENENIEDLYPCEVTNVSYLKDIVPILEAHCYRCHDYGNYTTFAGGNLLEGYDNITGYLSPSANINDQYVYGNVAHLPGFTHMPGAGLPKIDACSIEKIKVWIAEGYPNN